MVGANVKGNGPFSFIHIRVLHLKIMESQIIMGPPSLKTCKHEKLKIVSRVVHGKPTLLTTTQGGHG